MQIPNKIIININKINIFFVKVDGEIKIYIDKNKLRYEKSVKSKKFKLYYNNSISYNLVDVIPKLDTLNVIDYQKILIKEYDNILIYKEDLNCDVIIGVTYYSNYDTISNITYLRSIIKAKIFANDRITKIEEKITNLKKLKNKYEYR